MQESSMSSWPDHYHPAIKNDPAKRVGRLRQRLGLIVKGKRISCPPPQHLLIRLALPVQEYDYEHGFPLIRSLRASTQRSTSVLFSFVLSMLIVAGSFAVRQSKTSLRDRHAIPGQDPRKRKNCM